MPGNVNFALQFHVGPDDQVGAESERLIHIRQGVSADYQGVSADYQGVSADYQGVSADYQGVSAEYRGRDRAENTAHREQATIER